MSLHLPRYYQVTGEFFKKEIQFVITYLYALLGPLSVERIANVRIRDLNALTAVGRMCPQLTSIDFEEDDNQDDYLSAEVIAIYKTIFNTWSTVRRTIYINSFFH